MSQKPTDLPGGLGDDEWDAAFEAIMMEDISDEPEPRLHHYGFAHMVLPSIFLGNPKAALQKLMREGEPWLHAIWEDCGSRVPKEQRVAGEMPTLRVVQREGSVVALITMPAPLATTEAYYMALVGGVKRKWFFFNTPKHRYFTLEKSLFRAVVGEWVAVGQHSLLDDEGVPVDEEAFLDWVFNHW